MTDLEVKDLRKEFDVPGGIEIAVNDANLHINDGEFVTLVGPSGCGKTTTLRCMAGLEYPTSGEILFDEMEVTDIPANKRNIAMMFQNIALYPHMSIEENISYPSKVQSVPRRERHERAIEVAKMMQIEDLLDKYPNELSGGQRQRAALARTIVQDPSIFLMDEPLSDLDAKLKVDIRKEIQQIQKRLDITTVYVTHDQEEAMTMSDRIAVMNDGEILQYGTPDELYSHPDNRFVASFIGNPSMNFLTGNLTSLKNGTATVLLEDNEIEFDLEYSGENTDNSSVTVGIRPETIDLNSQSGNGDFNGEIILVERIGDRLLATVEGPQGELRATISADKDLAKGQQIFISIDKSRAHIFDADGELLAKGRMA